jgi:hypothetical protein
VTQRRLFALSGAAAVALCLAGTMANVSGFCEDLKKPAKLSSENKNCREIKDEAARKHCAEQGKADAAEGASPQNSAAEAPWQLARTRSPGGGPATVSIAKITDGSESDVSGLMLRCGEGASTAVLVVLTKPLGLRAHPKVTVAAASTTTEFTASVEAPGTSVLLPEKASALVEKAWQAVPELTVTIADDKRSLHGVIPLGDIGAAMQTLQANCPK